MVGGGWSMAVRALGSSSPILTDTFSGDQLLVDDALDHGDVGLTEAVDEQVGVEDARPPILLHLTLLLPDGSANDHLLVDARRETIRVSAGGEEVLAEDLHLELAGRRAAASIQLARVDGDEHAFGTRDLGRRLRRREPVDGTLAVAHRAIG